MKCKRCGAEIDDDSRYCEICGKKQPQGVKTKWLWPAAIATACVAVGLMLGLFIPARCSSEPKGDDVEVVDSTKEAVATDSVAAANATTQIEVVDAQTTETVAKEEKKTKEKDPPMSQKKESAAKSEDKTDDGVWVDLGLPSGTKWKKDNESGEKDGFYDWDEAKRKFGSRLPTKDQLEELLAECKWKWTGNGNTVTGPNGNSITLPAAGGRNFYGNLFLVGKTGFYHSSTPDGSDNAWFLLCGSGDVRVCSAGRYEGISVRLVQD